MRYDPGITITRLITSLRISLADKHRESRKKQQICSSARNFPAPLRIQFAISSLFFVGQSVFCINPPSNS